MTRRTRDIDPLPTIWRVPDDLWARIKAILDQHDPPKRTGRKRIDQRSALDSVIYRMRSGVQWNQLPKEFGDDSSVHRTFQRWIELSIFERVWAALVAECDELGPSHGRISWEWQAADAAMGKSRLGGTLLVRTRRIGARTG